MQIEVGDLVRIFADNCDCGLGLVVEAETPMGGAYRVLTSNGQCLCYFSFELHPLFAQEIQVEWVGP